MVSAVKRIDAALTKLIYCCIALFMFAMMMLIVVQVIARYFLFIPTPWAEEIARLSSVWLVFFAASLGVRKLEHMRVDALYKVFPAHIRLVLDLVSYALMMAFAYVLFRYGIKQVIVALPDFTTSLRYSRAVFFLPAPIGGALMFLYSLGNAVSGILRYRRSGAAPEAAE